MPNPTTRPSSLVISVAMMPFGVCLAVLGGMIVANSELVGRGGARMNLDSPWNWIIGGSFAGLGLLILLAPVYYAWVKDLDPKEKEQKP